MTATQRSICITRTALFAYCHGRMKANEHVCIFDFHFFLSKTKFFRLGQNLIIREQSCGFFLLASKVLSQGSIFYNKVKFILNFGPKRKNASFAIILLV